MQKSFLLKKGPIIIFLLCIVLSWVVPSRWINATLYTGTMLVLAGISLAITLIVNNKNPPQKSTIYLLVISLLAAIIIFVSQYSSTHA